MPAQYILATVGVLFLVLGARALTQPARRLQGRIWLLVGGIFAVISLWLFTRS